MIFVLILMAVFVVAQGIYFFKKIESKPSQETVKPVRDTFSILYGNK